MPFLKSSILYAISSVFIVMIFISCGNSNEKNDLINLKYKVDKLESKIKAKDEKISSIRYSLNKLQSAYIDTIKFYEEAPERRKDSIQKNEYIKKTEVEPLLNDKFFFLIDREKLITHVYNSVLKHEDIEEDYDDEDDTEESYDYEGYRHRLWYSGILDKERGWNDIEDPTLDDYARFVISKINRKAINLSTIFQKNKSFIFNLLNQGNYYKESGFKLFIKGLIIGYENSDKSNLKKIYSLSPSTDDHYGYFYDEQENYKFANKIASQELKDLFKTSPHNKRTNGDLIYDNFGTYASCVYTFWGRRYHENNAEMVYTILKEIDENVN